MSDFLIKGAKETNSVTVNLLGEGRHAGFPYDADAGFAFYSREGGFIHPENMVDSILTNPIHYGAGGFEGVRVYYSPYGTVFPELENNIIRLMYSTLAFDDLIQQTAIEELGKEDTKEVKITKVTPRELFEIAGKCEEYRHEPDLPAMQVVKKNGTVEERRIRLRMRAMFNNEIRDFSFLEIDAIMKSLAYSNKLVSKDYFPEGLEMVNSGYFRPAFWVSGEGGLKVPTGGKPMYFAVTTLPWGTYLKAEHYERGLDVVYGPYPRIGNDMATDKKVAGNYNNSAFNINLGAGLLGYGEILALKDNRVVEGSAENLFVVKDCGNGKYRVFTPPVGDGPLPGTTRDRVLRVLHKMRNVDIAYYSPDKKTLENACAVFFTGTGAQIIHIRSVTEDKRLEGLAEGSKLASEDTKTKERLVSVKNSKKRTVMINDGRKHPFIDDVQNAYVKMVLEEKLVRPVYDMDYEALGRVLGLELKDFTTENDREKIEWRKHTGFGDFADEKFKKDKNGGLQNKIFHTPNREVRKLNRQGAQIVERAFRKRGLIRT